MANKSISRTPLAKFDYHPVFIDYNFAERRPRGGSAYFDFFACGKLCSLIDEINDSPVAFISKESILPSKGFFLVDFSKMLENADPLFDTIKGLNLKDIYVEDSANHSLKPLLKKQEDLSVSYIKFSD